MIAVNIEPIIIAVRKAFFGVPSLKISCIIGGWRGAVALAFVILVIPFAK